MDKQLVVLGESGQLKAFQSGDGPFESVRLIDAREGLLGRRFTFSHDWAPVLEQAFGSILPPYVQFDLREVPASDKVAAMVEATGRLINRIQQQATEPFSIPVSQDGRIGIEFQPSEHDHRVVVACRFMGDTVVNYTDDGLVVDVFSANDMLTPRQSMQFAASDLMMDGDGSSEGWR